MNITANATYANNVGALDVISDSSGAGGNQIALTVDTNSTDSPTRLWMKNNGSPRWSWDLLSAGYGSHLKLWKHNGSAWAEVVKFDNSTGNATFAGDVTINDTGSTSSLTIESTTAGDDSTIHLPAPNSTASRSMIRFYNGQNWYVGAVRNSTNFTVGRADDYGSSTDFIITPTGSTSIRNELHIGTGTSAGLTVKNLDSSTVLLRPYVSNDGILITDDSESRTRGIEVPNGGGLIVSSHSSFNPISVKLDGAEKFKIDTSGDATFTNPVRAGDGGGRVVYGWHRVTGGNGGNYWHIKTNLWMGGSPSGNTSYIMGGIHVTGYRYTSTSNICDGWEMFHNWNGGFNNRGVRNHGDWNAVQNGYASSDGYYVIVLKHDNNNYTSLNIDFHQSFDYTYRDVSVTSSSVSNSSSGVY